MARLTAAISQRQHSGGCEPQPVIAKYDHRIVHTAAHHYTDHMQQAAGSRQQVSRQLIAEDSRLQAAEI